MAGPFPPYPPTGAEGQPPHRQSGFPGSNSGANPGSYAEPYPYPDRGPSPYPGPLPPPVGYPSAKKGAAPRSRTLWWGLAALAAVVALVGAALAFGGKGFGPGTGEFTDAGAQTAIQNYLNALSDSDTETIARNAACGMFDAIKDRKSDLALARLASDAFSKQFTRAEVTGIDKIVLSSSYQAQVLFTMKVAPASGSRSARDEQQGVAQLLRQDNHLLVCSYLLRTAAQY